MVSVSCLNQEVTVLQRYDLKSMFITFTVPLIGAGISRQMQGQTLKALLLSRDCRQVGRCADAQEMCPLWPAILHDLPLKSACHHATGWLVTMLQSMKIPLLIDDICWLASCSSWRSPYRSDQRLFRLSRWPVVFGRCTLAKLQNNKCLDHIGRSCDIVLEVLPLLSSSTLDQMSAEFWIRFSCFSSIILYEYIFLPKLSFLIYPVQCLPHMYLCALMWCIIFNDP